MRRELLDYFRTLDLGSFSVTTELPWNESGNPLYIRNLKRVYVDRAQDTVDPIISCLDGLNINNKTTTVTVFFATDAKQVPSNYETVIDSLRQGKDITTIQGVSTRECDVTTDYELDMLVTELTFRFSKIT